MPATKPLGQAVVVLVFTIFTSSNEKISETACYDLAGLGRLNVMTQALDDGAQRISRYLLMQFLVNATYGTLFGVGLFLIGLPHAILWGAIAGALRLIPYLGALTGAALPLVLALAVFNTWMPPLMVFALYLVMEGALSNSSSRGCMGRAASILAGSAGDYRLLDRAVGLGRTDYVHTLNRMRDRIGPLVRHLSFLHILLGDEAPLTPAAQSISVCWPSIPPRRIRSLRIF